MKRLLFRASARVLWQHPWQLVLALLGIATGVGVVAAVQLTQRSAQVALADAQSSLAGPATHRIEARQGLLSEAVYLRMAHALPGLNLAPVLRGACRATAAHMANPRYRNFFTPERSDIFAGFRTCALA